MRSRKFKRRYKKSYRLKRKKTIFQRKEFWLAFLVLAVLSLVIYFLVFSPKIQIKEIQISGVQKLGKEDIEKTISKKINKKIFYFNSKSIFLVNFKEIEENILKEFPRIFAVSLNRKLPDAIIVEIQERTAIGDWCQNECFLIDLNGIVFAKSSGEENIIIKSNAPSEIDLGDKVIEEKYLEAVLEIDKTFSQNLKIEISDFFISDNREKITVKTGESWEIYFEAKDNIAEQLFNLEQVIKEEILAEERGNLEYIDLRFGSKVYFKYRGE